VNGVLFGIFGRHEREKIVVKSRPKHEDNGCRSVIYGEVLIMHAQNIILGMLLLLFPIKAWNDVVL
jgi:hypothetical protein